MNNKPEFDLDERIAGLKEIAQHGNLWPEATTELRDFAEEIESYYKPMLSSSLGLLQELKRVIKYAQAMEKRLGAHKRNATLDPALAAIAKAEGKG